MTDFFLRLYDFFGKRKALLAAIIITVTAVCIFFATKMRFSEDISQFLPEDEQNEQANYAFQHIGAANTILVYFSTNDDEIPSEVLPDIIENFVEDIENRNISDYANKIQYTVDQSEIIGKMNFISRNLPYFLDEDDYKKIDTLISNENIVRQLQNDKDIISTIHGSMMQTVVQNDPLFISGELLRGLQEFKMNDSFELIDGYIFLKGGREAIVRIESKFPLSETANNKVLTRIIDEAAAKTMQENENVSIKPFGAVYISICNADQIKRDSILTISIALVLIILVLAFSFRSPKIIMSLPLALAFGMVFSFGINAMVYNEVSLIAIGISSVIIGIAANYPLHMIDHINHGYGVRQTISDIVSPLTIGNITTVGAFLSLLFISSTAMKNLGLFAAMLLVGTILFVLVVMPHIISTPKRQNHERGHLLGKIADVRFEDCKPLVGGILIITIVFLFLDKAGFDADMSKINYMTDEYRAMIDKLNEDTNDTDRTIYVVSEGRDIDEALARYESMSLKLHSLVAANDSVRLSSIGGYIPSRERQAERIRRWTEYWKDKDIYPVIAEESRRLGFKDGVFSSFGEMTAADLKPQDYEYFSPLTRDMAENYIITDDGRAMVLAVLHVKPGSFNDVKALINNELCQDDGSVFVFSQESVLSQVVSSLSDDFDYVLYICGFIVFFFLCISFGRLELSIISFIPLMVSWVWILAIMHIFGIQFNIINIILATFIFGMGDDYTIFMTEGCIYEHRYGRRMLNTYKNTVALSALIMFIGIGSLILAKHPAMRQLGEIVIVGMITVMLMAYTIPTLFFRWLTTKKGKPRRNPMRIKYLLCYIYSATVVLIGIIYMNILGLFTLIIGGRSDRHKMLFHKNICHIFRFMTRLYPLSRTTIHNNSGEERPFDKPSVIICNHQSQIDLLTLALDPKIIVLTQRWVWNFPLYGWIVRLADFYCIDNIDYNDLTPLRAMIDKGYSIMIFPEGHRSADCKITRFHKGAFYIAQQLGVDIQPLIIHGYGYALPKHDFTIKKGRFSIHIMPKVSSQGIEYQTLCSEMRKYYVKEYDKICHEIENADYYADEVINNYLYKGKDVERSARKSLRDNDNYKRFIECIPESGEVELHGCGMGVAPLMAALVRKNTTIRAVIDNEDDYLTAVNCASVPDNLHYILQSDGKVCDLTLYCDGH